MVSVGGSMGWAAMGSLTLESQIVSATVAVVNPEMAMMSPASASSTGTRSRPRKASTLEMRPCSTVLPSRASALTDWFALMAPERTRPVSTRPRKGFDSMVVTSMRKGPSSTTGGLKCFTTRSKSGAMPSCGPVGLSAIQPCLAEP